MKLKIKNNKIVFASLILLLIIIATALIVYGIKKADDEQKKSAAFEEKVIRSGQTSRVTFFHTKPGIGSLAIPEEWEGKYRVKESGGIVSFYYIGAPEKVLLIFSVEAYSEPEWASLKKENKKIIKSQDGVIYACNISEEQIQAGDKTKELQAMRKDLENILKSFKIFKL